MRKAEIRADDPMAEYMLKKQRKAQLASGVKLKPEYKGPAPKPNRFNVKCVPCPALPLFKSSRGPRVPSCSPIVSSIFALQAGLPLGRDRPRERLRGALVPAPAGDREPAAGGPAVQHVGAVTIGRTRPIEKNNQQK